MDVFGNLEVKTVKDDFYMGKNRERYDIFQSSGDMHHIATVHISGGSEGRRGHPEINSAFYEDISPLEPSERELYLERIEDRVHSDMNLEKPSDVGLVEAVKEAGL